MNRKNCIKYRIMTTILSIVLIVSLLSVTTLATCIEDFGAEGIEVIMPIEENTSFGFSAAPLLSDNTTYLYENFSYYISGSQVVITGYSGSSDHVNIPSEIESLPVTVISQNVFQDHREIISITIPNTVNNIYSRAFYNCSGLTEITVPESVKSISGAVFYGCSGLTSVSLFSSLSTIGNNAFQGCTNLSNVYYSGSESEWDAIQINNGNDTLLNSTIHYNDFSNTKGKSLLGNLSTIISNMFTWVGILFSSITESPILLFVVIGSFSLIAIGIIRRLFVI